MPNFARNLSDAQIDALVLGSHRVFEPSTHPCWQDNNTVVCYNNNTSFDNAAKTFANTQNRAIQRVARSLARNKQALNVNKVAKIVVFDSTTKKVSFSFVNRNPNVALATHTIVVIDLDIFRVKCNHSNSKVLVMLFLGSLIVGSFAYNRQKFRALTW